MHWSKCELGKVITLKRGYDLPQQKRAKGCIPIFSSSGITGFHSDFMVKGPGVITGRYGTIGEVFYANEDFWPLNTTLYVQDFHGNNPLFIYYYLKTIPWQQFTSASAVPGINRNIVHTYPVSIPDLDTQEKIVSVLYLVDEKIGNNTKLNENLLQQALCLFEDEFVTKADIDEELPLYNFADYINGAAFKPDELGDAGLPVIKIAELKAGITGSTRFFSGDKGSKYLVHNKDILFSWSGNPETSIDLFIWSEGNGILNQHTFNVKSKYGCPWFTFLMLKYHKPTFTHIASNKQTTGLGHVTAADLKRLTFPFDLDRMNAFETTVRPIMDLLYGNLLENRELSSLRDTLLPRLMSGELDVSDIDL